MNYSKRIYFYANNSNVYLDVFLCDSRKEYSLKKRPMMLICPGGGYQYCSPREAEPIARAYMAEGYNAAVLYYSVKESENELYDREKEVTKPHFEVAKSVCIIRDNAEKWNVDPEQIAVIGFSAGGHLAGCCAILWDDEKLIKALECEKGYNKPNAAILSYPVISSGEKAHRGSFDNLLGEGACDKLLERYSLEKQVKKDVCPIFVWHTATDDLVPVHNTTYLTTALADAKVPFEAHVFPCGVHGLSLANREVRPVAEKYNARWLKWSIDWLETIFNF